MDWRLASKEASSMNPSRLLAASMLATFSAAAVELEEAQPPLLHVVTFGSEEATVDSDHLAGLLRPLACVDGKCRRIVDPSPMYDDQWLSRRLAAEPSLSARLAKLHVTFENGYLSIVAILFEAKLDATGRVDYESATNVILSDHCAGEDCRLPMLGRGIERIAAFWRARLTPESAGEITAKFGNVKNLPLVRDVLAKGPGSCESQYGDYPVVKDLGDHFWLAFPDRKNQGNENVVMVPRCGLPSF
jgi:hypothetical protein